MYSLKQKKRRGTKKTQRLSSQVPINYVRLMLREIEGCVDR